MAANDENTKAVTAAAAAAAASNAAAVGQEVVQTDAMLVDQVGRRLCFVLGIQTKFCACI